MISCFSSFIRLFLRVKQGRQKKAFFRQLCWLAGTVRAALIMAFVRGARSGQINPGKLAAEEHSGVGRNCQFACLAPDAALRKVGALFTSKRWLASLSALQNDRSKFE